MRIYDFDLWHASSFTSFNISIVHSTFLFPLLSSPSTSQSIIFLCAHIFTWTASLPIRMEKHILKKFEAIIDDISSSVGAHWNWSHHWLRGDAQRVKKTSRRTKSSLIICQFLATNNKSINFIESISISSPCRHRNVLHCQIVTWTKKHKCTAYGHVTLFAMPNMHRHVIYLNSLAWSQVTMNPINC